MGLVCDKACSMYSQQASHHGQLLATGPSPAHMDYSKSTQLGHILLKHFASEKEIISKEF